jgi:hypothetical protein
MSTQIIAGLLLQAVAVFLVVSGNRYRLYSSLGVLVVVVNVCYHGVSEVLQLIPDSTTEYRTLTTSEDIGNWLIAVGGALAVFALVYRSCTDRFFSRASKTPRTNRASPLPPWQYLMLFALPAQLAWALFGINLKDVSYWTGGLVQQYALLLLAFTAAGFIAQTKTRHQALVLCLEAMMVALMGSRTSVLICMMITLWLLTHLRVEMRKRQVAFAATTCALLFVAIFASRAQHGGMLFFRGNLQQRPSVMYDAMRSVSQGDLESLVDNVASRTDGNSHASIMYARKAAGYPGVGPQILWNDIILCIPQFVFSTKYDLSQEQRNERSFVLQHYDIPAYLDFPPTLLFFLFSLYGIPSLYLLSALSGWLFAFADFRLSRSHGFFSCLLGASLVYCAVLTEGGFIIYFVMLRGLLGLYLLFRFGLFFRRLFRGRVLTRRAARVVPKLALLSWPTSRPRSLQ